MNQTYKTFSSYIVSSSRAAFLLRPSFGGYNVWLRVYDGDVRHETYDSEHEAWAEYLLRVRELIRQGGTDDEENKKTEDP